MSKIAVLVILLLNGVLALSEQQAVSVADEITQEAFIQHILAQEKLLKEAQIGLDIKAIEMNTSRENYQNWSLNLSAKSEYSNADLDRDTDLNHLYSKQSTKHSKAIGLVADKRFLTNPSNLKMGVVRGDGSTQIQQYKQTEFNNQHRLNEAESRQYIRYKYPLLKHDGNAESLKTYHRDIIDLQLQKLSFFETKEDILQAQLSDYLSWVELHNTALIRQTLLDNLSLIVSANSKDQTILKNTILQTKIARKDILHQLTAIKSKIAILLDENTILSKTPKANIYKQVLLMKADELRAYLPQHNRDLERIRLNIELRKINIKYYQNRSLPSLDFSIGAEKIQNKRNTKSSIYDDDRIYYNTAITFSVPLGGDIANQANLKKDQLGIEKLQISYADKQQDILADADELGALLVIDEAELKQNIQNNQQSLQLEKASYSEQKSSMRDLISAYKALNQSKLLELATFITYQKRYFKYQNLLDQLIPLACPNGLANCVY